MPLDRLITNYQEEADWYKNEMRFMEADERAVYAEARQICLRVVTDLKQLQKEQDAHSTPPA